MIYYMQNKTTNEQDIDFSQDNRLPPVDEPIAGKYAETFSNVHVCSTAYGFTMRPVLVPTSR